MPAITRAAVVALTGLAGLVAFAGTASRAGAQQLLLDINVGVVGSTPSQWSDTTAATVFTARDGGTTNGDRQLWRSDGTPANTQFVEPSSVRYPWRSPVVLASLGNQVLYRANDQQLGYELWITDGTPGDARSLGDLNPGLGSTEHHGAVEVEGRVFMAILRTGLGTHVLVTDGTPTGTRIVSGVPAPVFTGMTATARGVVYSGATAGGYEPVFTDGTAAGTVALDLEPGPGSSSPGPIGTVRGLAVFRARTTADGDEPWVSDGTVAGTRMLANLAAGPAHSLPKRLAGSENLLWMGTTSGDVVVTDGTPSGTRVAHPGARPMSGVMLGDRLVYSRGSTLGGITVSVHDGAARTDLGTFYYVMDMAAASDGHVYFVVRDAAQQYSIWVTDGTLAGTRRAGNLPASTRQVQLGTAHRGKLFLSVEDPIVGVEPFVLPLAGTAERAGRGCARAGLLPVLDANIPRLGASLVLRGSRCAPSVVGVTVFGSVAARPLVVAGSDCALLVAADGAVLLFGATTVAGTWLPPAIPIPNVPPLVGLEFAAQAGFNVRGVLEASNAVHVRIGT